MAPSMSALLATFQPGTGEGYHTPGGEPLAARMGLALSFRHAWHIASGVSAMSATDTYLLVATQTPPALQRLPWHDAPDTLEPILLSSLPWLTSSFTGSVTHMEYSHATDMSIWLTDTHTYLVSGEEAHEGVCVCESSSTTTAMNARFSLLALGGDDGDVRVYECTTPTQPPTLSHTLHVPTWTTGRVTSLAWSSDGYALAVGWEHGWSLWSSLGHLLYHSFRDDWTTSTRVFRDTFAKGIQRVFWGLGGTELFVLPKSATTASQDDALVFVLPMLKAVATCHMRPDEASASFLMSDDSLWIYRGREQSDAGLLTPESDVWRPVRMPAAYLATQWPIRYATLSDDGRFIAMAGRRGLAHYSTASGHWKLFEQPAQAHAFYVRGGLLWFQHVLIAACDCNGEVQIRLYSRDQPLDNAHLLDLAVQSAPVVTMELFDTSLLLYLADNTLVHYMITTTQDRIRLRLCGSISFEGIISEPARVRAFGWLPAPSSTPAEKEDIGSASLLFLIDSMLILLHPVREPNSDEVSYDLHILHEHLETFWTHTQAEGPWPYALWGYDGRQLCWWLDVLEQTPVRHMRVDAYPIGVLLDRGIVLGAEATDVVRRTLDTATFRLQLRTTLFVDQVLRALLTDHRMYDALDVASSYASLRYFSHILEVLLHSVLEDEADAKPPIATHAQVLPTVLRFVDHFPEGLAILARAARKTEAKRWPHLFAIAGRPATLLHHCLERHDLETASSYLVVVNDLEDEATSIESAASVLAQMEQAHMWGLLRQVLGYVRDLDEDGTRLAACLQAAEKRVPGPSVLRQTWQGMTKQGDSASTPVAPLVTEADISTESSSSTSTLTPTPHTPRKLGLSSDGPRRPSSAGRRDRAATPSTPSPARKLSAHTLHRAARHASLTLSPAMARLQANGRLVVGPPTPSISPRPLDSRASTPSHTAGPMP
ncbi:WD40 repeat protein [Malassezia pachydermatis]